MICQLHKASREIVFVDLDFLLENPISRLGVGCVFIIFIVKGSKLNSGEFICLRDRLLEIK